MSTFLQDFRYSLRQLFKNPSVSVTAILSLALGIGATVSVFSIIYAVIMNPWPYQGADRIANVALLDKSGNERGYGLNGPQTRELAKDTHWNTSWLATAGTLPSPAKTCRKMSWRCISPATCFRCLVFPPC